MTAAALVLVAHALAAAVALAAFAFARPAAPPRLAGRGTVLRLAGGFAYFVTEPLVRRAVARRVPPAAFTVAGLALSVLAGAAAGMRQYTPAGLLLLWGALCDLVDGEVARGQGAASAAGAFLDSTLDRFGEAAVFVGLAFALDDRLGAVLVCAAACASLLVSYARARAEASGAACPSGGMERPQRLALLVAALCAAGLLEPAQAGALLRVACALVALGAGATAAARTLAVHASLRRARAGSPAPRS